jgi:hypothetical protein
LPEKIVPQDPNGFGKHVHNIHEHANGQHHPVPTSFFEEVAKSIRGAGQILIFGHGAIGGSAMNELITYLQKHHKDVSAHIVGAVVVDENHLTEDEMLGKARDFYRSRWGPIN